MRIFVNATANHEVRDISDKKTVEQIAQQFGGSPSDWTEVAGV